jgi:hypothetical protein
MQASSSSKQELDPDLHRDFKLDVDGEIDVEMEDVESNQGADEEWRARYRNEGRSRTMASSRVERGVEVGSAMNDFINSDSCRRKIPTLFFGNDKTRTFHIASTVFSRI